MTIEIITPTVNRSIEVIERCIASVIWQQGMDKHSIRQIVCTDGDAEPHVENLVERMNRLQDNVQIEYAYTGNATKSYGGGVRHFVMENILKEDILSGNIDYMAHLDDDNILYPHFLQKNIDALEQSPDAQFSICKVIHFGPLPSHLGLPPQVISGIPPVLRNIDTLQVVVRAKAMLECGWEHQSGELGYYNDGFTYERLGKMFSYVEVPEILGIHV